MVTLKACIIMKDMRKDGTWRVVIRLTYKRKSRMIPTSMYVSKEDITASGNIKNQQVIDECERIIRTYQKRIRELLFLMASQDKSSETKSETVVE